jgi:hypothetical protein
MAETTTPVAKKLLSQRVADSIKGQGNKAIGKDIIAGTKFGESVVGEGDLGRLGTNQDIQSSMDVLRQGAQGYSGAEATARREQAMGGIATNTQAQQRAMQAALARSGVTGGAAGRSLMGVAQQGQQAQANAEQQLFIQGEQARQSGAQNLLNASSDINKFDLGQAAKEKNIALQSGFGFAQLGSAERAAFLSSQSADKAAAARQAGMGGGGGGSLGGSLVGGLVGGPVGAVAGIFCHYEETNVLMEDNTFKKIKDIELGDITKLGGKVTLISKMYSDDEELYEYKGEVVTGTHYVLTDNDEMWLQVKDCKEAVRRIDMDGCVICPMETTNGVYLTEGGYLSADLKTEYVDLVNKDFNAN